MMKLLSMTACALALPLFLYLFLIGTGSGEIKKTDRWLEVFQTVHSGAQLHSTSREIGKHFLDPRVRKILRDTVFSDIELRNYRVMETPVQIITFPPEAPLDKLIQDGAEEYQNEDFQSRRFRLYRSGPHLLIVRMLTAGSPMGRKKVSPELFGKIKNAFLKETLHRGHPQN